MHSIGTAKTENNPAEQVQQLQKQIESLQFSLDNVARLGAMITSILDVDTILSVLIELALEMVGGEVGGILIKEEEDYVTKVSMGLDPVLIKEWKTKEGDGLLEKLIADQDILFFDDAHRDLDTGSDSINIDCLLVAPVSSKGQTIGAIVIANKNDGGVFSDTDVANLSMLVHFTAVAIDNAKVLELTIENQKMEHELKVGQLVQEALLPNLELKIPGAIIDASYTPARQVGGDYYDIIKRDDKHFALVMGDVTNKGVPAALMMSSVRSLIRAEYRNGKDAATLINSVNQLMCEDSDRTRDMFVTLFFVDVDLENKTFTFINAGHPPPYISRKHGNDFEELKAKGIILGQFAEFNYKAGSIKVDSGDRVVFYTDGAFECFDSAGEMLGLAGFKKLINDFRKQKSPAFLQKVNEKLQKYMVDEDKIDDTTLLVIDIE
ncbi:MAG: SpoIIE family protein phosphatase [candidate division Zixibacteria bacterium]|nr:SpoIIE family protein phosphatase [candidate division Zixibacteria bacterium]